MRHPPAPLSALLAFAFTACSTAPGSSGGGGGGGNGGGGTDYPIDPSGRYARYDMGAPALTDLYLSPDGDDGNDGASPATPLRSLDAAWRLLPEPLDRGYRLAFLPGTYPCGDQEATSCLNNFSGRHGTRERPLVLESVDATGASSPGTATLRGGLDLADVSYVYLIGLRLVAGGELPMNTSGNDVLHLAGGDHLLVRNVVAEGPPGRDDTSSNVQEVIKTNQVDDLYIEDSDLSGTFQTVVDVFSARHGHLLGNRLHGAGGRCAYIKGGSAYWLVAENEIWDCVEAGVQAGEGSTLNLMTAPFLHYEAYDLKIVNNVVHDVRGPGLSVAGGYAILFAYNTLYRVGLPDRDRQWGMFHAVYGGRSCMIVDEYPSAQSATDRCQSLLDLGGWGTATSGGLFETGGDWVPNANVLVYDNLFYNPVDAVAAFAIGVNGPQTLPGDAQHFPSPVRADEGLVFAGNVFWNGGGGELLASTGGGEIGCDDAHPTCTRARIAAENVIDGEEPALLDPAGGDLRPAPGGNVETRPATPIPPFVWGDFPAGSRVPEGNLENEVPSTFGGAPRSGGDHPGAL